MIIKGNLLPLCLFADNPAHPEVSVKVVDIWLFRWRVTLDLCTSTLWTILPKGMSFRHPWCLYIHPQDCPAQDTHALNRGGSISASKGRGKEASWSQSSTAELGIRRTTRWPWRELDASNVFDFLHRCATFPVTETIAWEISEGKYMKNCSQ